MQFPGAGPLVPNLERPVRSDSVVAMPLGAGTVNDAWDLCTIAGRSVSLYGTSEAVPSGQVKPDRESGGP
jgi:hypothetical protein